MEEFVAMFLQSANIWLDTMENFSSVELLIKL